MNKYEVTFRCIEESHQSIIVEASTQVEAREKAEKLTMEGVMEFNYSEADTIEEHIVNIEKL